MRKFILLLTLALMSASAHSVIYFSEDFNANNFPYGFDGYIFGYTNDTIQTFHEPSGGIENSGHHRIPLGGPSRTNFNVFFNKGVPNLPEYYTRFYLKVPTTFANDGENWKLTYNYTEETGGERGSFVFWFRPISDGLGFQPAFFSGPYGSDLLKTENVPTFYLSQFKDQWISFEYYINLNTNTVRLWITTEDGRYDETLYISANDFPVGGTAFNNITYGSYWDGTGDSNYFLLDDVVISDTYIGPSRNPGAPSQPERTRINTP